MSSKDKVTANPKPRRLAPRVLCVVTAAMVAAPSTAWAVKPWQYLIKTSDTETAQVTVQQNDDKSRSITVPQPYGTYMTYEENTTRGNVFGPWASGTRQEAVWKAWMADGHSYKDGISVLNGYYLIACTRLFGNPGDRVDFELEDGTVIQCIVGDTKNLLDPGCNFWGHDEGRCVLEVLVDPTSPGPASGLGGPGQAGWLPEWSSRVAKATNYGLYEGFTSSSADKEAFDQFIDPMSWVEAGIAIASQKTTGYQLGGQHSYSSYDPNGDIDCSGFVRHSLILSGAFKDEEVAPFATKENEVSVLTGLGFEMHELANPDELLPGDILWYPGHTEIYVGKDIEIELDDEEVKALQDQGLDLNALVEETSTLDQLAREDPNADVLQVADTDLRARKTKVRTTEKDPVTGKDRTVEQEIVKVTRVVEGHLTIGALGNKDGLPGDGTQTKDGDWYSDGASEVGACHGVSTRFAHYFRTTGTKQAWNGLSDIIPSLMAPKARSAWNETTETTTVTTTYMADANTSSPTWGTAEPATPPVASYEDDGWVWTPAPAPAPEPLPAPAPVEPAPVPEPAPAEPMPEPAPEPAPDEQPAPEGEPSPDGQPAPDAEPAPEEQPAPDTEAAPDGQPTPDEQTAPSEQPAPEVDPSADAESAPDTQPAPEGETAPDAQPIPEEQPVADGQQPAADAEPAPEAAPQPEAGAEPVPGADAEPAPDAGQEPVANAEPQAVTTDAPSADAVEGSAAPVAVPDPVIPGTDIVLTRDDSAAEPVVELPPAVPDEVGLSPVAGAAGVVEGFSPVPIPDPVIPGTNIVLTAAGPAPDPVEIPPIEPVDTPATDGVASSADPAIPVDASAVPAAPTIPDPAIPSVPEIPSVPSVPEIPSVDDVSGIAPSPTSDGDVLLEVPPVVVEEEETETVEAQTDGLSLDEAQLAELQDTNGLYLESYSAIPLPEIPLDEPEF